MTIVFYVLGVLAVVVGIGASIALHEIGHLVPAKTFGVRCTQYMIGFGPTLWSRRRGETEYGIKAIPLGGYVRMIGMFPPKVEREIGAVPRARSGRLATMIEDARADAQAEIEPGQEHRAFYRLQTWQKIVVMLGGPVMNLLIATVILTALVLVNGVAVRGADVASVARCVRPATAGAPDAACTAADAPSPAFAAGMKPGDRIVEIDGDRVDDPSEVGRLIRPHTGETVPVVVQRGGTEVTLSVTPIANSVPKLTMLGSPVRDGDGKPVMVTAGFIGTTTAPPTEQERSIGRVPDILWSQVSKTGMVVLTLPQRMIDIWNAAFGTAERDVNGPMSVVGVGRVAGEVSSGSMETSTGEPVHFDTYQKLITLWSLLGGLNVALFVFNLIPLLPLDGGHVAGALWEALKRGFARLAHRPDPGYVDVAKALPLTYAVSIVLLTMSVLLIYADIVKPVRL